MRTKIKVTPSETVLDRILEAFGQELINTSDEEIIEAAKDLGMDLQMKESAAFAGITFPAKPQLSDFFDLEVIKSRTPVPARRKGAISKDDKPKARELRRTAIPKDRKASREK